MKYLTILVTILVLLFSLTACSEPAKETISVVGEWNIGPVENGESIVETPGGPGYAGNTAGVSTQPLDPVETTQATLVKDNVQVNITYRDTVKIWRSDTRPNIINMSMAGQTLSSPGITANDVTLYTPGAPMYMSIASVMQWSGGLSNSQVLMFQASEKMTTGKHTFKLGIMVKGVDYGTIPCTVEVINTGVHPVN